MKLLQVNSMGETNIVYPDISPIDADVLSMKTLQLNSMGETNIVYPEISPSQLALEKDQTLDNSDNASEMLSALSVIKNQLEIEQKNSSKLQKDKADLHLQLESVKTEISNLTAVNLNEVAKVDEYQSSLTLLKIQIDQEKDTNQILNAELAKEKQRHSAQGSINLLRIEELETKTHLLRNTITQLEFNAITNKGQLTSSNKANDSWQAENLQLKDTVKRYQRSSKALGCQNEDLLRDMGRLKVALESERAKNELLSKDKNSLTGQSSDLLGKLETERIMVGQLQSKAQELIGIIGKLELDLGESQRKCQEVERKDQESCVLISNLKSELEADKSNGKRLNGELSDADVLSMKTLQLNSMGETNTV
jgi:chromosome segregation ATPase